MAVETRNQKNFGRIGVLMGGASSEREVSLKSGKAVLQALEGLRLEVTAVDIPNHRIEDNIDLLKSKKLDCAFIALHGRFGEDGQIQEILEMLKIPYTGSGVLASRLAMDKAASRQIFEANGLRVPKCRIIDKRSYSGRGNFIGDLGLPLVVKPATHGSSIGLSIVDKELAWSKAVDLAFDFDERIIIEEYISGREVTSGILDGQALPTIEIMPKKVFFDYEAKYKPGMAEYLVPARLSEDVDHRIKKDALTAHRLLGCFGCSRVDMILAKDNQPYILEVNTIPGLTSLSLLPKAAGEVGISFSELCLKLLKLAYEKKV